MDDDDPTPKTIASGNCGESVTWVLDEDGTLTISGTGAMQNFNYEEWDYWYNTPWRSYTIKTVVINAGVASIGNGAFYNCFSITSVAIPESVISIGENSFRYCGGLTSITIPDSVTTIGDYAFSGCTSLTSTTIPNSVVSIGYSAFSSCPSLKIYCYKDSTAHRAAFFYGIEYVLLDSDKIDPSNGIFASGNCGNNLAVGGAHLTWSLDLNGTLTISGTGGMRGYDVEHDDYSIAPPWYFLRSYIKAVVINSGATNIGCDAFYGHTALTSVSISDTVTSIGTNSYSYRSYSYASGIFRGCTSLTNVTVDASNSVYSHINGVLTNKSKTEIIKIPEGTSGSYTIPDGIISIGTGAFSGCTSLTSVTIPDSVTTIGSHAFSDHTGEIYVTIPKSVTSIGNYAFSNSPSLTIYCYKDSTAYQYAFVNFINYVLSGRRPNPSDIHHHRQRRNR